MFVEKYGEPTSISDDVVTTAMGAKYQNQSLTWFGDEVIITLSRYGGNVNEGLGSITTKQHISESAKEATEKQAKAVDKL
ncbi:MAG: hypothetical protein LC778_19825 [Acidobacteria bacterium]|nr:hypothetical protein [Acidobacteriota bacterium]